MAYLWNNLGFCRHSFLQAELMGCSTTFFMPTNNINVPKLSDRAPKYFYSLYLFTYTHFQKALRHQCKHLKIRNITQARRK